MPPAEEHLGRVYHISKILESSYQADSYHSKGDTSELEKRGEEQQIIQLEQFQQVRVQLRLKGKLVGFNPPHPIPLLSSIWLHHPHKIEDLQWDPGKWSWKAIGQQASVSLFNYNTKLGYRVGIQKRIKPSKYEAKLKEQGCSDQKRRRIYG